MWSSYASFLQQSAEWVFNLFRQDGRSRGSFIAYASLRMSGAILLFLYIPSMHAQGQFYLGEEKYMRIGFRWGI